MNNQHRMNFDLSRLDQSKDIYSNKPIMMQHDLYLTDAIESPDKYIEWFELLHNSTKNDIIKIHINSPGGNLYTTVQLLTAMSESDANIICSVEGACMSAATLIFLTGDSFYISPYAAFMFHNYSTGLYGKGGEIVAQVNFEKELFGNLMRKSYENFLEPKEIEDIIEGKDLWLGAEDVVERLKKMQGAEKLEESAEAKNKPKPKPRAKKAAT